MVGPTTKGVSAKSNKEGSIAFVTSITAVIISFFALVFSGLTYFSQDRLNRIQADDILAKQELPSLTLTTYITYKDKPDQEFNSNHSCIIRYDSQKTEIPDSTGVLRSPEKRSAKANYYDLQLKIINNSKVRSEASGFWLKSSVKNHYVIVATDKKSVQYGYYANQQWQYVKIPPIGPKSEFKLSNIVYMMPENHAFGGVAWQWASTETEAKSGTVYFCRTTELDYLIDNKAMSKRFLETLNTERARCAWLVRNEPVAKDQYLGVMAEMSSYLYYCPFLDQIKI
jgi:hypothetical protein